jgi:hypothetical protein
MQFIFYGCIGFLYCFKNAILKRKIVALAGAATFDNFPGLINSRPSKPIPSEQGERIKIVRHYPISDGEYTIAGDGLNESLQKLGCLLF